MKIVIFCSRLRANLKNHWLMEFKSTNEAYVSAAKSLGTLYHKQNVCKEVCKKNMTLRQTLELP